MRGGVAAVVGCGLCLWVVVALYGFLDCSVRTLICPVSTPITFAPPPSYYAFHFIYQYVDEPFTSMMPESLFNVARFLLNSIVEEQPFRLSRVYILYTLAKQGKALGAFKLARYVCTVGLVWQVASVWVWV